MNIGYGRQRKRIHRQRGFLTFQKEGKAGSIVIPENTKGVLPYGIKGNEGF